MKRTGLVTVVRVSGLYSELSNGRGGTNVEAFVVPDGFDKAKSLAAFKDTLYPVLRANCSHLCIQCRQRKRA